MRRATVQRLASLCVLSCATVLLALAPTACGKYGAPKRAVPPVAAPSAAGAEEATTAPEDDEERARRDEETKR